MSQDYLRQHLRKKFREQRKQLTAKEQSAFAVSLVAQARKHVFADPRANKFSTPSKLKLALYQSFDGELDTFPLVQYCWSMGHDVYLPLLHPFSKGHLLFQKYSPETKMCKNAFGIFEPALDVLSVLPANELDILFTPLVAFDDEGNRLGMGGGFYDRTLQNQVNNLRVIGLAHDLQKAHSLPCETWDIPLPEILTPSQYFIFAHQQQ